MGLTKIAVITSLFLTVIPTTESKPQFAIPPDDADFLDLFVEGNPVNESTQSSQMSSPSVSSPVSTLDLCKEENGHCLQNDGQCETRTKNLVNSADDFCFCCLPVSAIDLCKIENGHCIQDDGICETRIKNLVHSADDFCFCCLPVLASKKCDDKGGFCTRNNGMCNGIVTSIRNSNEDTCICCIEECGPSVRNRIKGGYSPTNMLGAIAALHKSVTDLRPSTHFCGAVLISDNHLLTAAHCLVYNKESISINIGKEDLCYNTFPDNTTYRIQNYTIHPDYDGGKHKYHDLAILTTTHKVQFTSTIWPICLPDLNMVVEDVLHVEISGWGLVNKTHKATSLKTVSLNLVNNSLCESLWRLVDSEVFEDNIQLYYPQGLSKDILCGVKQGVTACQGDSGGPMFHKNKHDGLFTLIGLISAGINCPKKPSTPGFFTNVTNYLDWIYETTGLDQASRYSNCGTPLPSQHKPSSQPAAVCPGGCGRGKCSSPKRCTCDQGYSGSACELPVCPGGCGRGKCSSPKRCTCDQGYSGSACELSLCPRGCSGNGQCTSPNTCTCTEGNGWYGSRCQCHEYDRVFVPWRCN